MRILLSDYRRRGRRFPAPSHDRIDSKHQTRQLSARHLNLRVIRHVRPKLSCGRARRSLRRRPQAGRSRADAPAPGLPAFHALRALNLSVSYAREDVDLSRSTLTDIVGQMALPLFGRWGCGVATRDGGRAGCMPATPWCRCWSPVWARRADATVNVLGDLCAKCAWALIIDNFPHSDVMVAIRRAGFAGPSAPGLVRRCSRRTPGVSHACRGFSRRQLRRRL